MGDLSRDQLIRWSESLASIAQTGLSFADNPYDLERYEQILQVAADIRSEQDPHHDPGTWREAVTPGPAGYGAAKSAVGAFVGNESGELLLIKRSDNHRWFVPTGWADAGYSLSEVVAKEVEEETGILVEPTSVALIVDGMRAGAPIAHHTVFFVCEPVGGELKPHPHETDGAGWFAEDAMPEELVGTGAWVQNAFAAIRGELQHVHFDAPRAPIWRS